MRTPVGLRILNNNRGMALIMAITCVLLISWIAMEVSYDSLETIFFGIIVMTITCGSFVFGPLLLGDD